MKIGYWTLAAVVPTTFLAAQGPYGAQLAILGLTLGIFFGTLSLRKVTPDDATSTHPGT